MANDSGLDCLVLELVSGTPLDKLSVPKGLPLAGRIKHPTPLAAALAAAYAASRVPAHRVGAASPVRRAISAQSKAHVHLDRALETPAS